MVADGWAVVAFDPIDDPELILLARSTARAYGFVFGNSWTSDNPSRCFARWLETAFNPS